MAESNFSEVLQIVQEWAARTDQILHAQLKGMGIGISDELFNSLRNRVYQQAGTMIGYDLSFLMRGRYRDMGAGRRRKIESIQSNGDIIRGQKKAGRKAKKWYSKAFYGRLSALNGVVSAKLSEQAIAAIINPLKN
jgi:hypothetical protein